MAIPVYQSEINQIVGHYHPNSIHYNSMSYRYHWRSLYQRVVSVVDFDIPDSWDMDYFEYLIWILGYAIILPTKRYGIIPQHGTLRDLGIMYQPTRAVVSNKWFDFDDLKIWKDCAIIKLSPDYCGIADVIDFYAKKFSLIDASYNVSLINTKIPYIVSAKNKSYAQTFKAVMDKVNQGEPLVVYESVKKKSEDDFALEDSEPWNFLDLHAGENYISDKLADQYRIILNQFDTEIGIPNNQQSFKKERLLSNEIESNNAETSTRLTTFINTLERSIDRTNNLYDLDIKIKKHEFDTGDTGRKEVMQNG